MNQKSKTFLQCDLKSALLPVITSFVEKSARAFGMGEREALALTLAAEELANFILATTDDEKSLKVSCIDGVYYTQLDYILPLRNHNFKFLNLTTDIDPTDESRFHEIGLLIAARSADKVGYQLNQSGEICLSIQKDKSYPEAEPFKAGEYGRLTGRDQSARAGQLIIQPPEGEDLKFFCRMVLSEYVISSNKEGLLPGFMHFPGKVTDMVRSGDYQAALAFDERQNILGGVIWRKESYKTVELYGPFIISECPGLKEALYEYCLEQIGHTDAVGIINRSVLSENYQKYFEPLGLLRLSLPDGSYVMQKSVYRQLNEDPGARITTHYTLRDYLEKEYKRLYLPRELVDARPMGEQEEQNSVFSAAFEEGRQVTLRPLSGGSDAAENLSKYLLLFKKEGILNVFFEMDLGYPRQWELVPALLENNFIPRLIIPWAGKGDLLIFQFEQKAEI